jgi:alanine racemase
MTPRPRGIDNPLLLRPTVMDVDLDALAANYAALCKAAAPADVMPVVKADAYGHGGAVCARHLVDQGAKWLGVAIVEEGIELRQAGIDVPILVFGGIFGAQIGLFLDHDLDLTALSVGKLLAIDEAARAKGKRARVHLKIDTGMGRIGVRYDHAEKLFDAAMEATHCDVVGVFSHFATISDADSSFANIQLERFLESLEYFEKRSLPLPIRHISSSAGITRLPQSRLDLVRPGLALYGVYPHCCTPEDIELLPVMSLRSRVVYFKVVPEGAGISYSHTWVAGRDTRVVTIPVGYGDGFFRRLSNQGNVLIRGKRYPIIGNVCMDQMMVDIGQDEAFNDDEVVLIGEQGGEKITVEEIAGLIGTNTHEVLVSTNLRVPRRYTKGDQVFFETRSGICPIS